MKLTSLTFLAVLLAGLWSAQAREAESGKPLAKSSIIGQIERIAVNRINLPMENNGNMGQDGQAWFPNGQASLSFLFAGGPAMSGYVDGQLRTAWMAAASRIQETQPGLTGTDPDAPEAKFYVVDNRSDGQGSQAYVDWTDAVNLGADYQDIDGNGSYDPNIDRPDILGDYTVWTAYNDGTPLSARDRLQTEPMGIDILQTVWAFDRSDALGNVVFIRYRIINTNVSQDIEDFIFTAWVDPDLGAFDDDLIGCDIPTSLGYIYNSGEDAEYGTNPPAFGIDFFQGPIVEAPGDTAFLVNGPFFGVDTLLGFRNLPLTSYMYYIQSDPTLGDPNTAQEARNYQEGGVDRLGVPIDPTAWGVGGVNGATDVRYFYNGDPVTNTGWLDSTPSDKRFLMNTGPFQLAAGDTQDVVVAYIVSRSADALTSLDQLRTDDLLAQASYDNNFKAAPPIPPVTYFAKELDQSIEFIIDLSPQLSYGVQPDVVGSQAWEGIQIFQTRTSDVFSETINGQPNIALVASFDVDNEYGDLYVDTQTGRERVYQAQNNLDLTDLLSKDQPLLKVTVSKDLFTDNEDLVNFNPYNFTIIPFGLNIVQAQPNTNTATANDFVLPALVETLPTRDNLGFVTLTPGAAENKPFKSENATQVAGSSEGRVVAEVFDRDAITGHDYEVSFFDNGNFWRITDLASNSVQVDSLAYQSMAESEITFPVVDGISIQVYDQPNSLKSATAKGNEIWLAGRPNSGFGDSLVFNNGFDLAVLSQENSAIRAINLNATTTKADYYPVRVIFATASSDTSQAYYYNRPNLGAATFLPNFYGGVTNTFVSAYDVSNPSSPRKLNILYNATGGDLTFSNGNTNLIMIMNTDYDPSGLYDPTTGSGNFRDDVYMLMNLEVVDSTTFQGNQLVIDVVPNRPNADNDVFRINSNDLGAVLTAQEEQDILELVNVVPNPYFAYSSYEESYDTPVLKFTHLTGPATIRIFNLAGQLVKTLRKDNDAVELSWDLRNEARLRIASGMYIAHIEVDGVGEKIVKFGVIQREDRIDRF